MSTVIDRFDSFDELLAYAKKNTHNGEANTGDSYFCGGTVDLSNAVQLAYDGWHDEREQLDKMLSTLSEQIGERFSVQNRTMLSVVGSGVHMGRFLGGRPDHMVGFRRVPTARHGRIVKVVLDYGANSKYKADWMLRRGVAVTALVEVLNTLGLSVELWTETSVKFGSDTHTTLVKMHDPREPMDIDSLMYAIAHPSMLRRLTFGVREMSSLGYSKCVRNNYGSSVPITQGEALEADIIINRIEHGGNADMVDSPVDWIMQTIRGLGVLD